VDRVGPLGTDWIETAWLKRARELLAEHPNTWKSKLAADHLIRIERMKLSLDGLGLGDALGEMLSYRAEDAWRRLGKNDLPCGPWFHTDDTEMAISIYAVLKSHGFVHQDALARRFARRFERDPDRGYGSMTRIQMHQIIAGAKWRETAANAFGGQGSMGNGGAMRVAPLGAYFADDVERCAEKARTSALVTHTHPEGVAGAIAVALGAAMAWRISMAKTRTGSGAEFSRGSATATTTAFGSISKTAWHNRAHLFFDELLRLTPESRVRRGIMIASQTPPEVPAGDVARALGNGSLVTAPDTVPFCLWLAARHLDNFVEALAQTISCGGDCDTNAAIVGGIVALSAGSEAIPTDWLQSREPLRV
jgi:ADP-ribosylglycohydrolase